MADLFLVAEHDLIKEVMKKHDKTTGLPFIVAWLLVSSWCNCLEITLVHTNDMHAWLDEGSKPGGICAEPGHCYGGFPRIKYFVDNIKQTRKNVMFLNAGDNFQGTNYYTLYKWKPIEEFIDRMGIDAMSLGNHEFDDGISGVVPYLRRLKTPSICANIMTKHEPSFQGISIQPWKLFNIEGRNVAVVGYLTPETTYLASTRNLTILDEIESLRRASRDVRKQGADIVIALGHSGWDRDLNISKNVPGIDVLVGGHSHTFHYTGTPPDKEIPISTYPHFVKQNSGKLVPMVQAYAYTKYVGLLNLTFDESNRLTSANGNPVLMDHTIPEDEEMLKELDEWKNKSSKLLAEVVGRVNVTLNGVDCRKKECNLGNFISDSFVDHCSREWQKGGGPQWTDVPIALINSGDIRASIEGSTADGTVTFNALLTAIPYQDTLVKVTVNGVEFKNILEHSASNGSSGKFLQLSGVKVVYDTSRPEGDRVVYTSVRCSACFEPFYRVLSPEMNITFVTTGFMSNGGDGYSMLLSAHKKIIDGVSNFEVVKKYLKRMSPVDIGIEQRITLI